jgi:hypothetical protein
VGAVAARFQEWALSQGSNKFFTLVSMLEGQDYAFENAINDIVM